MPKRLKKKTGVRVNRRIRRALGPSLKQLSHEYIRCSLDPFGADSARVPDGTGLKTMHIKYTSFVKATPVAGVGAIVIAGIPSLPAGLIPIQGTFAMHDGGGTSVNLTVSAAGPWPMEPFIDFSTRTNIRNVMNIESARLVSYGLEVRPTAPVLNQGGVACAARIPFQTSRFVLPEFINGGNTIFGVTGIGGGNTLVRGIPQIPTTYENLQPYPDVQMCSGTDRCRLVGTPASCEFKPVNQLFGIANVDGNWGNSDSELWYNQPPTAYMHQAGPPAFDAGTGGAIGVGLDPISRSMAIIPDVNDKIISSSFWHDNESPALIYAASGLSDASQYEIRFVMCVEATVDHLSSTYRPFVSTAPPRDDSAINLVTDVKRAMPVSVADDGGSNWFDLLNRFGGAVSKAVGFARQYGPTALKIGALALA
jgi:hypothetical protein